MPRWAGCPPSSEHGVGVRGEQCVPGVNGIEVRVSAHGSKSNDAVIVLVKAGGFGINDRKDRLARHAWGVAVEEVF